MGAFDTSFREYFGDYLLILIGVFGGNIVTVGVMALFGGSLPEFLGLTQVIPSTGSPFLTPILTHFVAIILLTIPPAFGVLAILYLDYLSRK